MNLLEQRKIFGKHSGRFDLVHPETWEDNGANFFIRAGVRMLDRMCTISAHKAAHFQEVARGEGIVYTPECSDILEVVWTSPGVRQLMHPATRGTIAKMFNYRGTPIGYEIVTTTSVPDVIKIPVPTVKLDASLMGVGHYVFDKMALHLAPVPDTDGTLIIHGNFFSQELVEDTDQNIWTAKYPELLGAASLWALEVYYRNTEGANDWQTFVQRQLAALDEKEIESTVRHTVRMEG